MATENVVDNTKVRNMFNAIRNEELKNSRIDKYDDKAMARRIAAYIEKEVKMEGGENDEV